MRGLALNWLVLGGYATLDWRGRRKDCKKNSCRDGKKKTTKKTEKTEEPFQPFFIFIHSSRYLPPSYRLALYHTVSFAWLQSFSIFSFFLFFFSLGNKHVELAMV